MSEKERPKRSKHVPVTDKVYADDLVVHDREDRFVPFAEGQALVAAWPGSELLEATGLGHHRLLRDAGIVDRVAASFDAACLPSCGEIEECLSA